MAKKFTIFGDPVEHSISPKMHTFAIEGLGVDATYTKTHLRDSSKLKDEFLNNFDAANVTVPHKEAAYKQCDEVKGIAKKIEAVNTLINKNGKMIGYNTDAEGFVRSVEPFGELNDILILGAGGTAKALAIILNELGKDVTIVNRSANRLGFFKDMGIKSYCWSDFELSSYDLVVNTTSAGLQDQRLPLAEDTLREIFSKTKFAVDVIYNKKTPFLKLAQKYNLPSKDGADMLLYQGVLAFDLFYDHLFELEEITKYMREAFRE